MPRIVRFQETGGPEVMRLEEQPSRDPGEGELRIRVRALGLNRAEAMFRGGMYLEQPRLPGGLGYEAAGLVDAVGPGVSGFEPGQAVSTIPAFSMNDYPMYGEVVLAPVHAVVAHPPELGFTDAAAVWMQYLTAWGALVDIAQVGPGDVVLVPAATSSVGLAAIQLCHAAGARPVALTRSRAKADALARAVPDTAVVFTDEQDIAAEVMRLTVVKPLIADIFGSTGANGTASQGLAGIWGSIKKVLGFGGACSASPAAPTATSSAIDAAQKEAIAASTPAPWPRA